MQTANINVNVFFTFCFCLYVAEAICDHVMCFGNPGVKRSPMCTCDCQNTGVHNPIMETVNCTITDDQDLGLLFDSLPLAQSIDLTCGPSSAIQRHLNESTISKHNSTLISFRSHGCKFYQINQYTFKNFKNLSEVAIVNGNITDESIPAFLSTPTLINLNLDSNHFPRLDSYAFCNQNVTCALQTLSLRSNRLHNISESTFRGLSRLLKLDLSENNLETVPIDQWSDMKTLLDINLTRNRIKYLPNNTALQKIETFDVSVNKLTRYNLKMGRGTWNFLQYLNVSHNEISIIKTKDFVLYGVKVLDLSSNKIEFIENDAFDDVAYIELIDLRYNRLKKIPDDYYGEIEYLYFYTTNVFGMYFYGNPLECGCERIKHLKRGNGSQTDHLRVLDYTQLMCVEPYSAAGQLVSEVSLQNVLCPLDWRSDNVDCPFYYRMSPDNNVIANCSYLKLPKALIANINILDFTASLRISDVYYLVSNIINLENLYELYLSDNLLWDMQNDTFVGISSLRTLHLDRNNFTELTDELGPLVALEELHMENNSLRLIGNDTFVNNANLTHVYLHDNELEFLPEGIFDPIHKLEVISLHKNPFQCACGNRWLKFWLKENIHIVHNPKTVMCFTSSGQSPLVSLDDDVFACKDDKVIDDGKNFTSIIVVSCVSGIFLAISLVIFKFRYAIRVILYTRFGMAVLNNEDDQDNVKTYDAYICYSSKDLPVVMTSLIPRLEGMNPPFKLCIQDRDFPIGACIATTIIESVKASRRSIILLSRNFLASEWCIMGFKAAHRYALKHQKNYMIVVLLEPIPNEDILNEDIKFYLSSNTYVEWTDPWFWDKLYFALPKKNANSEVGPVEVDNEAYQDDLVLDEI